MHGSLFVLLVLSGLFWSSSALSRQYHYINASMSWPEAQSFCRERFTDLATVDSIADVNRLVNIVDAGYNGSVWIGLKKGTQKRWGWSNGDAIGQFNNWFNGEPQSSSDCGIIEVDSWRSFVCSYSTRFSCYNKSTGYLRIDLSKNWTDAQNYCRMYHTDLSTMHNREDSSRVHKLITYPQLMWVGLFQDSWEWSDNCSRFFRYWAAGQPSQSSGSGDCVGMSRNNSGKWAQHRCDLRQPFVCHGGELLPYIYHYINASMSWPEAQSFCRERFTDLATVDSIADVNRLVNIVDAGYNGSVWIGLKKGTQKRWGWSNGDAIGQYSNWLSGEPLSANDCALIGVNTWRTAGCTYSTRFSCYNESTGHLRIDLWKNWTDAQNYCRMHHTDLSTLLNKSDSSRVHKLVIVPEVMWVGLFQDSWEWSDNCSRFFRYWAAGQPYQSSGSGDCVGMSRNNSGKWAQHRCDLRQPFVCHGDEKKFARKQTVKLKLSCNGKCALNDHSVQTAILKEISEKLKSMGLGNDSKISWRRVEGEEVFHEEINQRNSQMRTQRRMGSHHPPASNVSSPLYQRILQFQALSSLRQQGTEVRKFALRFCGAAESLGYNDAALKDLFNSALEEPLKWWRMRGLDHLTFGEFVEFLARSPARVAGVPQAVLAEAAAPPVVADKAAEAAGPPAAIKRVSEASSAAPNTSSPLPERPGLIRSVQEPPLMSMRAAWSARAPEAAVPAHVPPEAALSVRTLECMDFEGHTSEVHEGPLEVLETLRFCRIS
ncbi:macrophage mannose receptor 1-like [Onychostoma macrolepis]|uniref:macrophage mannose receptor 1-like n=1 Tax=Onychostoma macrolepis TaxID=369639 RepID=UPI00272A9CEA|nr:macrophage mannose receptor 1-like [Onychostoma macrolepis]